MICFKISKGDIEVDITNGGWMYAWKKNDHNLIIVEAIW